MKLIQLLSILFLLTSCAGLRKYRRFTTITSSKPGVAVYNEEKQFIGRTPFLYHLPYKRTHIFYLKKKNQKLIKLIHKCEWNISASAIVEGLTRCERDIIVPLVGKLKQVKYSKTLPILPNINSKEELIQFKKFLKKNNFKIKNYYKHEKFFQKYGIYPTDENIPYLQAQTLRFLYKNYKYNRILIFEENNNRYLPKLIDVHSKKVIKIFDSFSKAKSDSNLKFIFSLFNLMPNSISLNYFFQGRVEGEELTSGTNLKLRSDKRDISSHPDSFPKYIPLISIENTIYPFKYSTFDFKLNFAPSLNSYAFRYTDSLNGNNYFLEVQSYFAFYNAYINLISPIGTSTVGVGAGAGFINAQDNQNTSLSKFNAAVRTTFYQTFFFNDRIFSKVGINMYSLPEEFQQSSGPFLPKNYTEYFFSIGLYFPELKSITKNYLLD